MKRYPSRFIGRAGGGQLKAGDIAIAQVSAKKDILSSEK
jgi:hypothetical protein